MLTSVSEKSSDMSDWNSLSVNGEPLRIKRRTLISLLTSTSSFYADSQVLERKMILEEKIDGVPIRKLFISNIPWETKNKELYGLFKQFGEIVSVFISRKFQSDEFRRTTYGFITFKNTEGPACALAKNKLLKLNGVRLCIRPADSWHQPIVNADGTVDFKASFCYNKKKAAPANEDKTGFNDSVNENDDGLCSAIGTVTVTSISSQEAEICPISVLNDDCLWCIFSHLSFDGQVNASKVCSRWHTIVSNIWRKIEVLDFNEEFVLKAYLIKNIPLMDRLRLILENIGINLKKIICNPDNGIYVFTDRSFISLVARYCANLEVLEISNIEIAKRSCLFLARQCQNLKKITFNSCMGLTDQELSFLLSRKNSKLKEINLIQLALSQGKFFNALQPPIRHISLEHCMDLQPHFLMLGLARVKDTLESLSITDCMEGHRYDLKRMASLVPKLKYLKLGNMYNDNCPLDFINKFSKLESLDLSYNYELTDEVLRIIVAGMKQLKILNISGSSHWGRISGSGIAELSKLPCIEELTISCLDEVDDDSIKYFTLCSPPPPIKKLTCNNCKNLGDKGVSRILSYCKDLELLDLRGCSLITNETLNKALTCVKKRSSNIPLKIMIDRTRACDESKFSHPLLVIDLTELEIKPIGNFLFGCGDGSNGFCGSIDCQDCTGFDEDDIYSEFFNSDDEVNDFYVDIDDVYACDSDVDSNGGYKFVFNIV